MSIKTDLTFPLLFHAAAVATNGDIDLSLKLVTAWIKTEAQAANTAQAGHPPRHHSQNTGRTHVVTRIAKLC